MPAVTLQRNNEAITLFMESNGHMNVIETDIDGTVDIFDQLINAFDHHFGEQVKFTFNNSKSITLPYNVWYHLYKTIDNLMSDIFDFELEQTQQTFH